MFQETLTESDGDRANYKLYWEDTPNILTISFTHFLGEVYELVIHKDRVSIVVPLLYLKKKREL